MSPDAKKTAGALVLELGKPMGMPKSKGEDAPDMDGDDLHAAAGESAADDAMSALKSGDSAGFYAAMKAMFDCMKD